MAQMGMDPEVVEGVGKQLQQLAAQIQQIVQSVETQVNQAHGAWQGKDSDDFLNWWASDHKPALQKASEAINGLGQSAINNATEQRSVSSH